MVRFLAHMFDLKLRDENVLEFFAEKVRERKFTQTNHLTQILYFFAKFQWRSSKGDAYL